MGLGNDTDLVTTELDKAGSKVARLPTECLPDSQFAAPQLHFSTDPFLGGLECLK